jgi:hypothetical protein
VLVAAKPDDWNDRAATSSTRLRSPIGSLVRIFDLAKLPFLSASNIAPIDTGQPVGLQIVPRAIFAKD